ncbi:Uncharacterized protein APZ42_010887 [Daphnia magna]|uniref:Uncharacterized protein n=1 Tax=Daphnia magna TaxID=35525 RepID=A0A162T819_9CRUS|nr:Uncharacterized protein APZ42_010887 [Daphnia magna]
MLIDRCVCYLHDKHVSQKPTGLFFFHRKTIELGTKLSHLMMSLRFNCHSVL